MNKDTTVVYFHGYGSSSKSDKVSALTAVAPDIPVTYDEARKVLVEFLTPLLKNPNVVFVGTSLGGYWATIMSDLFGVPAVIINPSTTPRISLNKYRNPVLTCAELAKYPDLAPTFGVPKVVLLAKDDEVFDYKIAEKLFADVAEVKVFEKGGHRFNDINTISDNIDELLDHSFYLP